MTRPALFLWVGALALAATGCEETKPAGPAPSRFDSVKSAPSKASAAAQISFCEKVYPGKGEGSRKWVAPPDRPVPKAADKNEVTSAKGTPGSVGWTWVNFWASWCGPCISELPLLSRWKATLEKEGLPIRFELWSVDEDEGELRVALDRTFPGEVRWIKNGEDLPALLEQLGVDKSSAIPIHALVDPSGMLRCVRVGSVGEEAYGTIKSILVGG